LSDRAALPSARRLAARYLGRCLEDQAIPEQILADPGFQALGDADRRLCHEILYGALRQRLLLDALLARLSRRPPRHLPGTVLQVLRTAAYQILFLERVPAYAAVSEAVADIKRTPHAAIAPYVNGVLRNLARQTDPRSLLEPGDGPEAWSVRYSHPAFLVERWLERHPAQEVRRWLERSNQPQPHFLTVRTGRIPVTEFLAACASRDIPVRQPYPCLPVVELATAIPAAEALIDAGLCFPQDLWSAAIAHLLPDGDYRSVADICAAPGGKSFGLADRFPLAKVFSLDHRPERVATMRSRAATLGYANLFSAAGDALSSPLPAEAFDLVLLDAPCSGTGTLQRNPDIRWKITPEDSLRLSRRQTQLLAAASRLVAPGGILAYVTCSAEPEENQAVAAAFLRQHQGLFQLEAPRPLFPDLLTPEGHFQSFPNATLGEGFFCAFFRRVR